MGRIERSSKVDMDEVTSLKLLLSAWLTESRVCKKLNDGQLTPTLMLHLEPAYL